MGQMGRFTCRIVNDTDPQSPEDWDDNGAFLMGWDSRNFWVGHEKGSRLTPQECIDKWKDTHHIFLMEAYIHSGIVLALMSEGNFCDRQWDVSSNIGAVFLSKKEWKTKSQKAWKYARGLVETWNQYLSGDVWGYCIDEHQTDDPESEVIEESVESCWGFYGHKYAKEEGLSMLKCVAEKADEIPTLKAVGVESD